MEAASLDVQLGQLGWHEYSARDFDAAIEFYCKVFEWDAAMGDRPDEEEAVPVFLAEGVPVAGIVSGEAHEPSWTFFVHTPDLDATIHRATELEGFPGGDPFPAMIGGRGEGLMDPCGGILWLLEPDSMGPMVKLPAVGSFTWHELASIDPTFMFDFYHGLFGWQKLEEFVIDEADTYMVIGQGPRAYGAIHSTPIEDIEQWRHYVSVEDVDETLVSVVTHGGRILDGPKMLPTGDRTALCADPQGAAFGLHQHVI